MPEIWKPIPGLPDFEASSLGRIRRVTASTRSPAGHVLTPTVAQNGYLRVCICQGGKQQTPAIHVLVCSAFHGPKPAEKDHAAHKDGNKSNNVESNLAWKTVAENQLDKADHGNVVFGKRVAQAKLTDEIVLAIRRDASLGIPRRALAAKYGVDKTNIGCIVRHETWRHLS